MRLILDRMEVDKTRKERTRFHFGDVMVDPDNVRVSRNGIEMKLSGKAFDLLVALLRAAPNLLSHDDIMTQVWGNRIVNDETIKQNISRIRSALSDDSKNPVFIESVRGKGYRCICPVEIIPLDETRKTAQNKKFSKRFAVPGLVLLLLFAALWFSGFIQRFNSQPTIEPPVRIAVLPFITLNKDHQDEYLADGLTEELISALAQSSDFKVLARTTTLAYRNSEDTAATIAEQLEVDAIVEGSIRRMDDRIRVYVQLIDGASEEHLLSLEFDRPYDEIFNIRSEVIKRISHSLIRTPVVETGVTIPTRNMDAYDDFLKGQANYRRLTDDSNNAAIVYFKRAIERDPEFADAYAWLANAYAIKSRHQIDDLYANKALEVAGKALQMSADSAVANKALGIAYSNLGRYTQARQSSERTLQLNARYPAAINNLASVYMDTGEFARAAELYKQLIEHYAEDISYLGLVYAHYAINMQSMGFSEIALSAIKYAVELQPGHPNVMLARNSILLETGRLELATQHAADYIEVNQDCTYCLLDAADNYYLGGDHERAMTLYQDIYDKSSQTDSDAAIRIAQIRLEFTQDSPSEINSLLEKVRNTELNFLKAGHEDWPHFLRLGTIASLQQDYESAFGWFLKAGQAGFYDEFWYTSEPTLEGYRQTDYYLENMEFIQEHRRKQQEYVLANGIDGLMISK
jgi:TolB-like protein/DNA-binding winged helix-turn-helix (wHTH) protein/Tfp pilus assembly protein PilF